MMKKATSIILTVFALLLTAYSAYAADFSQYSTEELAKMRGTMWSASEKERNTFHHEWQKRFKNMTPEERGKYLGRPENAGKKNMMNQRKRSTHRNTVRERGYGMGSGSRGGAR